MVVVVTRFDDYKPEWVVEEKLTIEQELMVEETQ